MAGVLVDYGTMEYRCATCGFSLTLAGEGYFYVTDDRGERIRYGADDGANTIASVLALDEEVLGACTWHPRAREVPVDLLEERIGYISPCVCLDCLSFFGLDLKRDQRKCPACGSVSVRTEIEAAKGACPRCGSGEIKVSTDG